MGRIGDKVGGRMIKFIDENVYLISERLPPAADDNRCREPQLDIMQRKRA